MVRSHVNIRRQQRTLYFTSDTTQTEVGRTDVCSSTHVTPQALRCVTRFPIKYEFVLKCLEGVD